MEAPAQSRMVMAGIIGAALMSVAWVHSEVTTPPPSSSNDQLSALQAATSWAALKPGRVVSSIAATGSMLPLFGSNSYVGLEPVTADQLTAGDVATWFDPKRNISVIHRVVEVRKDGVLFDGFNNHGSDGWIKPEQVRMRLAAIFYMQRPTVTAKT